VAWWGNGRTWYSRPSRVWFPVALCCVTTLGKLFTKQCNFGIDADKNYRKQSRVSCINTNRSHNLATSGESRRYVVAFTRVAGGGIWLRQKSLRHILACPWENRGKCYMNGKRIQCLSNASLYIPIYLQPFLRYCDISVASREVNERFI